MADLGDRDELQEFVRGRLSEAEAAALKARIAADPRLAAEHRLVAALGEAGHDEQPFPGEFGWARLAREIERETRPPIWRRPVPLWQVAAAAVLFVGAYHLTATLAPTLLGGAGDARYVTATGADGPAAFGASVRVVFAADVTEATMREVLRAVDARIVDGPGALGIYRLGFADEAARDAALARFATQRAVIEVVD